MELKNFNLNCASGLRNFYIKLRSCSKKTLSFLRTAMQGLGIDDYYLRLAINAYFAGYFNFSPLKETKIDDWDYLKMPFIPEISEKLGLNKLFRMEFISSQNPIPPENRLKVRITHEYDTPVSQKLFNYSKVLKQISSIDILRSNLSKTCTCSTSLYQYSPAGHVITGNLNIVKNLGLRNLFKKGTKFRTNDTFLSRLEVEKIVSDTIEQYISKLSKKHKIDIKMFENFKTRILTFLRSRLPNLYLKYVEKIVELPNYEKYLSSRELKILQSKYVISCADKAAGNYIFTCRKYYLTVMCNELGIALNNGTVNVSGNTVYKPYKGTVSDLIKNHNQLCMSFGCDMSDFEDILPTFFAVPKLHKSPYKMRFIAGANKSSTKPIAKLLHRILVYFRTHLQNYCRKIKDTTGKNCFWSIKDTMEALNKLHSTKPLSHLYSADFATLFTGLPHNVILKYISKLIDLCFNNSRKKYLAIGYKNVWYTDLKTTNSKDVFLEKHQILEMVSQVLQQTYITFAGLIFNQQQGVPMGSNSSPLLADLTLTMMEYIYMNANNIRFLTAVRYIDDILVFNDRFFESRIKCIYGSFLQLEKTHEGSHCEFLDLDIRIQNNTLITKVFNKTDKFNFEINRYCDISSNISQHIGLNTVYGQMVRFCRICSTLDLLISRSKILFQNMRSKGFNNEQLSRIFLKFAYHNSLLIAKFILPDKHNIFHLLTNILT